MVGGIADARDAEEGLGDKGAGEQSGQRAAHDGHDGDEGIAEGVMIDDLALGKALGPGGADIVGVEHLQHVGAGVAHEGAHAHHHQRDDGHHQVVCHIPELAPGGELLKAAPGQAVEVKPAQLHGEHQLEQGREEEGGQGNTGQRDDGHNIVGPGVLLGGSQHTQRDGDHQLQHQGDGAHDKGDAHALPELFQHGHGPHPAVAEVSGDGVAQPADIAGDDVLIQVIGCL